MSAFISLTRSFGVAYDYAIAGKRRATKEEKAFVYEIKVPAACPPGLVILDPLHEIAKEFGDPLSSDSYQHDGDQKFLLGVINPREMKAHLRRHARQPPGSIAVRRPPNLSIALETLTRALRDAELLAISTIPAECVTDRIEVY